MEQAAVRALVSAAKPCVLNTPALQQLPKKRCAPWRRVLELCLVSWIRIHKDMNACKTTLFAASNFLFTYSISFVDMKDGKHPIQISYITCTCHMFFPEHIGYCCFAFTLGYWRPSFILATKVGPLKGLMLIKSGAVSIMTLGQTLRTRCPKLA